jgi:anaphase-promoting complex subunit 10
LSLDHSLIALNRSDGQQPHLLTIHFLRRVEIRAIRFYVDYALDESYTPTHINFYAGTGHHDLLPFAEVALSSPSGWQDVPLADCGGGADGHSLCCHIVQVHVKENHQNGKDTHIRGIKIFALDESVAAGAGTAVGGSAGMGGRMDVDASGAGRGEGGEGRSEEAEIQQLLESFDAEGDVMGGLGMFSGVPEYMRDPEIR